VVASQDGYSVFITDFQSDEKSDSLHGIVTTIHVITHEQVIRIWTLTAYLEQLHEVMELAMDVTADGDGASHFLHIRLLGKNFLRLLAEGLDLTLGQLFAFGQLFDPLIQFF